MVLPALYCVSDPANGDPVTLLQWADEFELGFFQFRHKNASPAERLRVGRLLGSVSRRTTKLLVSQSAALARAIGAEGVHFPAGDFPGSGTRAKSKGMITGISVHSLEEAIEAAAEAVDYLMLAPVFAPLSKSTNSTPLGLKVLRQVCAAVGLPVIALGGLTPEHFSAVLDAGAAGIAGISLFATRSRMEAAARNFQIAAAGYATEAHPLSRVGEH